MEKAGASRHWGRCSTGDCRTQRCGTGEDAAPEVRVGRKYDGPIGHGLVLDAGAFVAALEYATGREATIVGKPSPAFFRAAAESMGVDLPDVAVVGDDITTDVAGA